MTFLLKILIILCLIWCGNLAKPQHNRFNQEAQRKFIVRCCGEDLSCHPSLSSEIYKTTRSSTSKSTNDKITNKKEHTTDKATTQISITRSKDDITVKTFTKANIYDFTSSSKLFSSEAVNTTLNLNKMSSSTVKTTAEALSFAMTSNSDVITTTSNGGGSTSISISTSASVSIITSTSTSTSSSTSTISTSTSLTATTTTTTTTTIPPITTSPPNCDNECPVNCDCTVNLLDLAANATFPDFMGNLSFKCGVPINMTFNNNDLTNINTTAYWLRNDEFCCSSCVLFQMRETSQQNRSKRDTNNVSGKKCVHNLYNVYLNFGNNNITFNFDTMGETQDCLELYGQNLTLSAESVIICNSSLYMFEDSKRVPACTKIQEMAGCDVNSLIPLQSVSQSDDKFCSSYQPAPCKPFEYKCFKNSTIRGGNEYADCESHDIGDGRLYYFMLDESLGTSHANASEICKSKCGMNLAAIYSPEQNAKLASYLYNLVSVNKYWSPRDNTYADLWIGLESHDQGVTWKWPGNISPIYFEWGPTAEPTRLIQHLCVFFNIKKNLPSLYHGTWRDLDNYPLGCDEARAFMCST